MGREKFDGDERANACDQRLRRARHTYVQKEVGRKRDSENSASARTERWMRGEGRREGGKVEGEGRVK